MSRVMASWVPGLPHLLHPEKSSHWKNLHDATVQLAERGGRRNPDSIVIYSTQWLSVLGTSFQVRERNQGLHIDDNWYDLGDLPFDFRGDTALGTAFVKAAGAVGIPSRGIDYESFPIDTGTIVTMNLLNSSGKLPVSIVSAWVYADAETSFLLGKTMRETANQMGRRPWFIASSLLTNGFFPEDIDPNVDRLSKAEDKRWCEKVLGEIEKGDLKRVRELGRETGIARDMQFNAFHWLAGVLGEESSPGRVMAFGPLWGTGAAVIDFGE